MTWKTMALKRALRPAGKATALIKGQAATQSSESLFPAYSASGQDVWLERPQFDGPGLILSAVGARCGKVFEASGKWGVVANTVVLLPEPGFDTHYLWYLVNNEDFWDRGGTAQPYVRVTETLERRLPLPPIDEQRSISRFLDRETVRIDKLIGQKKRLVSVLGRRRRALLGNLVIGRAWASSEIGPTGNSVLPELPVGWRPVRLRSAAREITVGVVVTPAAFYTDEGLPFVRGYNVRPGVVTDHDLARISPQANAAHPKSILQRDDVLVVRTGQAGAAAVVPDWAVGGNCMDVLIVRCEASLRPRFLQLVLNSEHAARQVETMSVGAIQSHFNVGALRDLTLPLPPLDEQDRLLAIHEGKDALMGRLADTLDRQIARLGEHRQALITAAVTGRMEIPRKAA